MSHSIIYYIALVLSLAGIHMASAHVRVLSPNGGEQFEVGSTQTLRWQVVIEHNQLNWDVHYSTVSATGPWNIVALDLPPGSTVVNSVHGYDWTVPNNANKTVWVRVIMDNPAADYNDTNDQPFSIIPAPTCNGDANGDANVNVSDLLSVIDQWGAVGSPADLNGDGVVNVSDLLMVVGNWGPCL
ncbi:MAG TPA: hypothetical protein EYO31_02735 [Phycisphaerales bacterium]|nr:hypothetical protein [Phycisphaerales bacterium]